MLYNKDKGAQEVMLPLIVFLRPVSGPSGGVLTLAGQAPSNSYAHVIRETVVLIDLRLRFAKALNP